MSEPIQAFPLQWPAGWPRKEPHQRSRAKFGKGERQYSSDRSSSWVRTRDLTIADGVGRVLEELGRMGIRRDDIVISTNVPARLDGLPRGGAMTPEIVERGGWMRRNAWERRHRQSV